MKVAALSLLVALIWGLNPIFEKLSLVKASPFTVVTLRFTFMASCLLMVSFVTGKYRDFMSVDGKTLLWIFLAGFLGGVVGLSLYFFVLKQNLTSQVVPIIATYPLFTALYAFIFLNESLSALRIIGIFLIVIGLICVNWNRVG
ncbi:MAG: hypothetical protein C4291_10690 [Candidatus Dadabacteria bacterium]